MTCQPALCAQQSAGQLTKHRVDDATAPYHIIFLYGPPHKPGAGFGQLFRVVAQGCHSPHNPAKQKCWAAYKRPHSMHVQFNSCIASNLHAIQEHADLRYYDGTNPTPADRYQAGPTPYRCVHYASASILVLCSSCCSSLPLLCLMCVTSNDRPDTHL